MTSRIDEFLELLDRQLTDKRTRYFWRRPIRCIVATWKYAGSEDRKRLRRMWRELDKVVYAVRRAGGGR